MDSKNKFIIKQLTSQDLILFQELIFVFEDVFEMKNFAIPNQNHLQNLLDKPDFMVFVALLENKVVGGLTAYILPSVYFSGSDVYLYDLAVKTEHQRKGIGRQIIIELKEYCRQLGHREIFVQADIDDQHALDFYKATGGQPANVIQYSYGLTNE
ncbi:MAG: GNAT family N-acetyltransferase [Saprospiraceae bacterium]